MSSPFGERVTTLLTAAGAGDKSAASDLLPLVYDELRRLARQRLARLSPGQTLQPTALVHEAYMRLVGEDTPDWDGKGHFFAAAAQAMRNVIVDYARAKGSLKRGGDRRRQDLGTDVAAPGPSPYGLDVDLVALDEALDRLAQDGALGPRRQEVVVMRYFAGLTLEQVAAALGVERRTIDRDWRYAKAWLYEELSGAFDG